VIYSLKKSLFPFILKPSDIDFDFVCSSNQVVEVPINFTMKGGDTYTVIDPIVTVAGEVST